MIERYTLPEMGKIWEDELKFSTWLKIEILACEARAKLGEIPEKDVDVIKEKAKFDVKRILEIEETTKHDVIAFLTNVAEYVGSESRHIHYGMTSSDILDTTLSCHNAIFSKAEIELLRRIRANPDTRSLIIGFRL